MPKAPKPKAVHYELLTRDSVIGHPMYCLLDELVDLHHTDLRQARIGLAWNLSWKPDADGRVKLGMCRKASDFDRELSQWDFVILLRRSFWTHEEVTPQQRRALLDHELCHAAMKYDARGEPVEDERGRKVYRTRRHDIEEFRAIVERYGTWTSDLEAFALALRRSTLTTPFEPCATCRDTGHPGYVAVLDTNTRTERLTRCPCWLRWVEQRAEIQAEQIVEDTAAVSA